MKIKSLIFALFVMGVSTISMAKMDSAKSKLFNSVVVTFQNGSYTLSAQEIKKIKSGIGSARKLGKIGRVEVAVWADKEHPVSGMLSIADRNLAQERIKAVNRVLRKDLGRMHRISTYNMTENAHWLGRHLHTNEAELDAVFAKKEPDAMDRKDLALIRENGAASKAVIVFGINMK